MPQGANTLPDQRDELLLHGSVSACGGSGMARRGGFPRTLRQGAQRGSWSRTDPLVTTCRSRVPGQRPERSLSGVHGADLGVRATR